MNFNICQTLLLTKQNQLVEIKGLPVFNKPFDKQIPAEATEIAAKIEAADGVIISTWIRSLNPSCSYGLLLLGFHMVYSHFWTTCYDYRCFIWYLGSSRCSITFVKFLMSWNRSKCSPQIILAFSFSSSIWSEWWLGRSWCYQELDAIFIDFRIFVKVTENCVTLKNFLHKMLKTLTGKKL